MHRTGTIRLLVLAAGLGLGLPCAVGQDSRPATNPGSPVQDAAELRRRLDANDDAGALAGALAALDLAPRDVELNLIACEAALRQDDLRTARHHADVAAAAAPKDPRPLEWSGFVLYRIGAAAREQSRLTALDRVSFVDAAMSHAEARQLGGDAYRNSYFEAEAYRQAQSYEKALVACGLALAARPADPGTRLLRARILAAQGAAAEATQEFDAILADPSATSVAGDAAVDLLQLTLASGDRAQIRARFLDLTKRFPDQPAAAMFRAVCDAFRGAGEDPFWPTLLDATLSRDPNDSLSIFYRGELALRTKDYVRAAALFQRHVQIMPNEPTGWAYLGYAEASAGRADEARQTLGHAYDLALDKRTLVEAFQLVVKGFYEQKRFGEAAEVQAFVVFISQSDSDRIDHAVILLDGGNAAAAEKEYREMLARQDLAASMRSKALNNLALLLRGTGRTADVESTLRQAVQVWPDDLDARENLGVLLAGSGRAEEAREHFTACLRADPTRVRSIQHLLRVEFPRLP